MEVRIKLCVGTVHWLKWTLSSLDIFHPIIVAITVLVWRVCEISELGNLACQSIECIGRVPRVDSEAVHQVFAEPK
jgi:hypothetical protein